MIPSQKGWSTKAKEAPSLHVKSRSEDDNPRQEAAIVTSEDKMTWIQKPDRKNIAYYESSLDNSVVYEFMSHQCYCNIFVSTMLILVTTD